ncbi:hypothetical protein BDF19DRAFT_442286 [Syncephalis fuscata]|nr:hypothetical protein BDF19DRAFT_442286 [Syncephalis fuscata]
MSDSAISTDTRTVPAKPTKTKRSKPAAGDAKARKRRGGPTTTGNPANGNGSGNNPSNQSANNGAGPTSSISTSQPSDGTGSFSGSTMDEPLCICQALVYEEQRFMILCDGCARWFHGDCVDVEEATAEFLDKYYCPHCAAKGLQISWRKECRRTGCTHAARENSKYCSDICGIRVALLQRRIRKQEQSYEELESFGNDIEQQALEKLSALYLASDDEILANDDDDDDGNTQKDKQQAEQESDCCQELRKTCRRHRGWIELRRMDLAKELSIQQKKAAICEHQKNALYMSIQEREKEREVAATTTTTTTPASLFQ